MQFESPIEFRNRDKMFRNRDLLSGSLAGELPILPISAKL